MEILYLLVPLSVVLVILIGAMFRWSLDHGQFDDLDSPGRQILGDEDEARLLAPGSPVTNSSQIARPSQPIV